RNVISGATFRVARLNPSRDDFSRQFPLGLHGQDIISKYPWKHAQTQNFIVHYIEDADARLTMEFIEGAYAVIVNFLGLGPERAAQKGHVFLFANDGAWKEDL